MNINGETKIIGFFGSTYKTSKMYAMYNAAFEHLKLNYVYIPLAVNDLGKAVEGVRHMGIHAVGVTIPYKIAIMPFLNELDVNAKRIGAVNVVINNNGKLIGGNTDGEGAVMALKEKTTVHGKRVILLGAGGVARAIAFALSDEGAQIVILNRTVQDAKELAKAVGCTFGGLEKLTNTLQGADILVQSTSIGMAPETDASLVPKELLRKDLTVFDVVSNPRETKLLKDAEQAGCTRIFAERMLLWQGAIKFTMYTGYEAPIEVMEKALKNAG